MCKIDKLCPTCPEEEDIYLTYIITDEGGTVIHWCSVCGTLVKTSLEDSEYSEIFVPCGSEDILY